MMILHKKGDMKDIKNYRPISLLSHMYKLFTRILQKRMEKVPDENQPREQAGFRKDYLTVDHLQTINQLIEKNWAMLFLGCLTSQQHASVSQGRISSILCAPTLR